MFPHSFFKTLSDKAGRKTKAAAAPSAQHFESLESRQLMSAALIPGGVLTGHILAANQVSQYTFSARIAMSTDGNYWNNAGVTAGSSFTVTGLLPGTTYYFEARDDNGSGVYSAYTPTVSATPTIAPPSNLVAARDEATPALDVLLTWANNASNITGINIARSTDGVNFDHLTTLNAGTTSYLDASGLVKEREYYYEIRAYVIVNDQTFYSAYSNIDAAVPR